MRTARGVPKELLEEEKAIKALIKKDNNLLARIRADTAKEKHIHKKIIRIITVIAKTSAKFTPIGWVINVGNLFLDLKKVNRKLERKHSFPGCLFDAEIEKELITFNDEAGKKLAEIEHHKKMIAETRNIMMMELPGVLHDEITVEAAIKNTTLQEMNTLVAESLNIAKTLDAIRNEQGFLWRTAESDPILTLESCLGLEIKRDEKVIDELSRLIAELKELQKSEFDDLSSYVKNKEGMSVMQTLHAQFSGIKELQDAELSTRNEMEWLTSLKAVFEKHRKDVESILDNVFKTMTDKISFEKRSNSIKNLVNLYEVEEKIFIEAIKKVAEEKQ